ncbi:MAG: hypothetical protein AXA67_05880 [Methylothermaceae bacteria B42]|nr:MAG: hypothetical protein AXA67_05880 [Methylothermaceae bacteria B42]
MIPKKSILDSARILSRLWLVQARLGLGFLQAVSQRLWLSVQPGAQPHLYCAIIRDAGEISGLKVLHLNH